MLFLKTLSLVLKINSLNKFIIYLITEGTKTQAMPAALAASMPVGLSSKTMHSGAATPMRSAATRNGSGAGLPLT